MTSEKPHLLPDTYLIHPLVALCLYHFAKQASNMSHSLLQQRLTDWLYPVNGSQPSTVVYLPYILLASALLLVVVEKIFMAVFSANTKVTR